MTVNNDTSVYGTVLVRVTGDTVSAPHSVTVTGGTASAQQAEAGVTVMLAPDVPEGMRFVKWEFDCDVTASGNMFVMPSTDVAVTAVFESDDAE